MSKTSFFAEKNVGRIMMEVLIALIPAIIATVWYFGWGILIQITIAVVTAVAAEALVLKLRKRSFDTLKDFSAVVTAVLFAVSVPTLLPWWANVLGMLFAIIVVKQLYGGLGFNPFNPAMAAYVFILISFPPQMTSWLPPAEFNAYILDFGQTLRYIFTNSLPVGLGFDAISMATPLDEMRNGLNAGKMVDEIRSGSNWGDFGGIGREWIGNWYLLGGVLLLMRRIITWRIPVSMMAGLLIMASIAWITDPSTNPTPGFHLFTGGVILGAFFIATDPVTASTTARGQLVYGFLIGVLIYVIRTWGNYPDAVAFSVLLLNMAAPTIDYITHPPVYGKITHDKQQ